MELDRKILIFEKPGSIIIKKERLPAGKPGEVLIETELSAVSAGTEMLLYRGEIPTDIALDSTFSAMDKPASYPLSYGYQLVGRIIQVKQAPSELIGARIFAFQPHQTHFWIHHEQLLEIPDSLTWEQAVMLPSMETAVNFLHDGRPLIGERAIVLGQGVVGLLTTALLAQHPLDALSTVDYHQNRRHASLEFGADAAYDPTEKALQRELTDSGADLIYELSGNPEALNLALSFCGFASRLILGSWYGSRPAALNLGGKFHRNRVQITSSQVSSIEPNLQGRWNKKRRIKTAWQQLGRIETSRLISHTIPFEAAQEAYQLVANSPDQVLQILLSYSQD